MHTSPKKSNAEQNVKFEPSIHYYSIITTHNKYDSLPYVLSTPDPPQPLLPKVGSKARSDLPWL